MTTTEQVKQKIEQFENDLTIWEVRRDSAMSAVKDEVDLCNRMIKLAKRSLKIYHKDFAHLLNGSKENTSAVASDSGTGQIY